MVANLNVVKYNTSDKKYLIISKSKISDLF